MDKKKEKADKALWAIHILIVTAGLTYFVLLVSGNVERWVWKRYYHPALVIPQERKFNQDRIGFITDVHSQNKKGMLMPKVSGPMIAFLDRMSQFNPDFVVEGGDFIEGTYRTELESINDYHTINAELLKVNVPIYHVLGNHELRGITKEKWLELTGYEKTYYYFDSAGYRYIVLDGNYIPREAGDEEVTPEKDYTRGYVSQAQMQWLRNLLEESNGYRKIVFLHQPPLSQTPDRPKYTSFPAKAKELREIFARYKVRAVFSGHIEEKYHEEIDGVDYYILPGFHKDIIEESQDGYAGVYSEIVAGREDVQVKMYHRDEQTDEYYSEEL